MPLGAPGDFVLKIHKKKAPENCLQMQNRALQNCIFFIIFPPIDSLDSCYDLLFENQQRTWKKTLKIAIDCNVKGWSMLQI